MSTGPIHLALLGVTGAGKSSFIANASGQTVTPGKENHYIGGELLQVGHGADSCTKNVQSYRLTVQNREVIIYDTPGFNDTVRQEGNIFDAIAKWLRDMVEDRKPLHGVIVLQPLSLTRVQKSEKSLFEFLGSIIGDVASKQTVVVSTMWNQTNEQTCVQNETNRQQIWAPLRQDGASFRRFLQNANEWDERSARSIISHFTQFRPVPTLFQTELQQHNYEVERTKAYQRFSRQQGETVRKVENSAEFTRDEGLRGYVRRMKAWLTKARSSILRFSESAWQRCVELSGLANSVLNGMADLADIASDF